VAAPHAPSAEFDANAPVKLQGPITKVEWVNPHAWIHIEVKTPDGKTESWAIEGGTPNTLMRRGISRDQVKIGTVIKVDGYQSKDGSLRANGRDITFPDGKTLFMGSSGAGASRRGAVAVAGRDLATLRHHRLREPGERQGAVRPHRRTAHAARGLSTRR
jgi:hypothetical protein